MYDENVLESLNRNVLGTFNTKVLETKFRQNGKLVPV